MPGCPPNLALQLTASRARSFGLDTLAVMRSRQLNGIPFGLRGAWSASLFFEVISLPRLWNVRCTSSVVQALVVPVWYAGQLC